MGRCLRGSRGGICRSRSISRVGVNLFFVKGGRLRYPGRPEGEEALPMVL